MERAELVKWILADAPARARGDFIFLQDPHATGEERTRTDSQLALAARMDAEKGWLCIPTGGSSGRMRFARHDEHTLQAAVSGFCVHFNVSKVNAVSVLPLHHVSGLMARVRAASTGGTFLPWDWKSLAAGFWPDLPERAEGWFISLVPTQLQRVLDQPAGKNFLRLFRQIFIGGGPTWPALLERAAEAYLPLSFSYGMTETAAMVTAQTASAFLSGERDAGVVMPHVRLNLLNEVGQLCAPGEAGKIQVAGKSVFRGYFPELLNEEIFAPEDLGVLNEKGRLTILGRSDGMIISGGEKVWPAEVEAALRATNRFSDLVVLGIPDTTWGSAVAAFYPAIDGNQNAEEIAQELSTALAAYKHPKRYVAVTAWPRNAQGKVNRAALLALVD